MGELNPVAQQLDLITRPLSPEQVSALRSVPLMGMPNRVRIARTMLSMNQAELARGLGIQKPNLSDIERGGYKDLMLETSRKLAEFFGCQIEDLFPPRESSRREAVA